MLILTIRTDNPKAEIGLYNDHIQLAYLKWQADRKLAESIHQKIKSMLGDQAKQLRSLDGVVVFKGPGSFTGLRIGISVANALADSVGCPVVGSQSQNWQESGINRLLHGQSDELVMPEYGSLPHITQPKK